MWDLGCGSWFRQPGFPKMQSLEPNIKGCISVSWCFHELKMVCSWGLGSSSLNPALGPLCSSVVLPPRPWDGCVQRQACPHTQLPAPVELKCLSPQPCAPLIYALTVLCPAPWHPLSPSLYLVPCLDLTYLSLLFCSSWGPHQAAQLLNLCHEWTLSWVGRSQGLGAPWSWHCSKAGPRTAHISRVSGLVWPGSREWKEKPLVG